MQLHKTNKMADNIQGLQSYAMMIIPGLRLLQSTPTSSLCVQSCFFHLRFEQQISLLSLPVHCKLSSIIVLSPSSTAFPNDIPLLIRI